MGNQLDDKTLRYISENAATEHMLLTPFRLLKRGVMVIFTIVFVIAWFSFTLGGWVFNVGGYSLENRREAVCDSHMYINLDGCDSTNHKAPLIVEWSPANNDTINGVHVLEDNQGDGYVPNRIRFDPLRMTDKAEIDSTRKPWINLFGAGDVFQRGDDVFRLKSAQMDRAIELAAFNAEELRSVIADIKHIDPKSVRLPDMPAVEIQRGGLPKQVVALRNDYSVTYGMCLLGECETNDPNLNYALYWGDVIWDKPALSPLQQHAVDALNNTTTLAFWLQECHANGVNDDTFIQQRYSASISKTTETN